LIACWNHDAASAALPASARTAPLNRYHEVGMIKSSPNALLAEGTDWRFLNELKRELKA
jgi:hypothetical protein